MSLSVERVSPVGRRRCSVPVRSAWMPTVLLSTAAALVGCGDVGSRADRSPAAADTVELDPTVVVGAPLEGDPEYLFGDVLAVEVDHEGRIYVGDRIGGLLRIYSPEGEFLGDVAREGEGPGEISGWAADLTFGPDGRLHVRDATRVTVFAPSSSGIGADSLAGLWRVPGYGNLSGDRSAVGADGTYYYPGGTFYSGESPRSWYVHFDEGQPTGDTLEVPPLPGMRQTRPAFYRLSAGGGPTLPGLNHVPFSPLPTWEATPRGTVLSTDGRSGTIVETDLQGDTVRVIRLAGLTRRPVPPAERADSLAALEARIDSLPGPLDRVVGLGEGVVERDLPDSLPTVLSVREVDGGDLWIERWPPEGRPDVRAWDVFDADGGFRASVLLRAPLVDRPAPVIRSGRIVGVVLDPTTDVERVVRFDLPEGLRGGPDD